MICNGCNTSLTGTPKFCPKCGAKVVAEQPKSEVTKKCPQCGADNLASAKFCKVDGFRLDGDVSKAAKAADPVPMAAPVAAATMLVCPRCGTQNLPNAKFCKKDGVPLGETSDAAATVQEVTPPPAKPAKEHASPSQPASVDNQVKSKPSKSKTVTIVGLIAALAAAGGAYWYFIYRPAQAEKIAEVAQSETVEAPKPEALTPEILKANINKALADAGLPKVGVAVDEDFDVELDGQVTSGKEKTKAFNIVKSVAGVAYITNNMLGPNDDPDGPWKPEDVAHMVNKEMSKSVGAGKTRAPLSDEELLALRQTRGADKPETQNQEAYDALIKAMKSVKEPLSHKKIQEILNAYPAPPPVAVAPAQEIQAPESQPSPSAQDEVISTPQNKVSNPLPEAVQKAAIVKQSTKKTEQVQTKKAKQAKSEPASGEASQPMAEPAAQPSPPSDQQVVQPAPAPSEQPKKHHGLRGLIESTTGVDPGAAPGATQHECTAGEKAMHTNGC